ncbi:MAG: 4Fe-4S dicluster domain-containing protein [candidate division Zixibacteria bacterium]|nr:4Fe-4S dicluster domain-containing protein [candidate division Zixibacteria bacterium]MBU1470647.1 4Fe-4S dicluster domain-containing protein [candidate division Zixibacteria bacterium]MBU2624132.1 4Fe-4S dicluster domain-containing protein [candidate division Zixibacteria bacterium]
MKDDKPGISRREFIANTTRKLPGLLLICSTIGAKQLLSDTDDTHYDPTQHNYAMGIDIHKCIGCGRCSDACKKENKVPTEPFFFRTWVERYIIAADGEAIVDSPNGGIDGFPEAKHGADVLRSFFVPKLCNHCANPPCVQVCPVGATFSSRDGVVLVDDNYCVGCRYCIQACPYGARYLHPTKMVADKCTFCYHRIVRGLLPACVEVCPTQARVFGEIGKQSSPLRRFLRFNDVSVLKPGLNTKPKVYYAGADGEVR